MLLGGGHPSWCETKVLLRPLHLIGKCYSCLFLTPWKWYNWLEQLFRLEHVHGAHNSCKEKYFCKNWRSRYVAVKTMHCWHYCHSFYPKPRLHGAWAKFCVFCGFIHCTWNKPFNNLFFIPTKVLYICPNNQEKNLRTETFQLSQVHQMKWKAYKKTKRTKVNNYKWIMKI